uniref:Sb:cb1058 n=1 Tax=Paramormyrops kingsleyae TaxID=1676925 RepID=A0A3B3QWU5_9TELE
MTIGKTRKKSLKFLDRADGSYWLLDEMEVPREGELIQQEQDQGRMGSGDEREGHSTPSRAQSDNREPDIFDFDTGMMEDDGTAALLRRKPSRLSSRWRRRSGSKKWPNCRAEVHSANKENMPPPGHMTEVPAHTETTEPAKPVLLHLSMKGDEDDKVLISEKESKNGQHAEEEIKAVKKKSLRNYTRLQAIDRAFRRGWETFVANLNSVTLSPISSSSPSSRSPTEIH